MLMAGDMKCFLFEVCAWCTDTCLPPPPQIKTKTKHRLWELEMVLCQ